MWHQFEIDHMSTQIWLLEMYFTLCKFLGDICSVSNLGNLLTDVRSSKTQKEQEV